MSQLANASATSLNFIGFDEMQSNGRPRPLYNRIIRHRRETAGKWVHPLAGYVPGQQPFLKRKVQVYNKSEETGDKRLARQGFKRIYAGYY